jgi:AGCS family alanine or glycine:cation symporter
MQQFIDTTLHPILVLLSVWLGKAVELVWYYPVVMLCLFCGIFFTLRFWFIQFRGFGHAIALLRGRYDNPDEPGQITHFQALMAALSGTIGLGNIAGVAIAISIGGPGTIFWMWIVGILGMATKFVECTLGTKYRHIDPKTNIVYGGPMFYIKKKLPTFLQPLGILFAISAIFGGFGAGGMFQANQAASALATYFNVPHIVTGCALAIAIAMVIIGGIKRIGQVASKIVPAMCIIYVIGALVICIMNITSIPGVIRFIISDAFSGAAVAGGSVGTVILWGVRRAVFSNEAGLGSAAIAHAAVKTNEPVREGLVGAIGPFIDTIVVCTATAIVIILGGNYGKASFSPTSNQISFETESILPGKSNSWAIAHKDDGQGKRLIYTKNTTDVESYQTHFIDVVKSSRTWYGTQVTALNGDAIQFKTKRGRGNYALIIRDSNGNKVAALKLHGDETYFFSSSKKDKDLDIVSFKLSPTTSNNTWQTHTLEFKEDTNDWVLERPYLHKLSLEFIVDKNSEGLEVDDIFMGTPKNGIALTIASFDQFLRGFGSIFISLAVVLFAFSTMITWSYYSETAIMFLFGKRAILPFKFIFVGVIVLGSTITLSSVLNFSDLMIGLMVIPNVIALLFLVEDVFDDSSDYFKRLRGNAFKRFK